MLDIFRLAGASVALCGTTSSLSSRSIRASVRRASIDILATLKAEHVQSSSQARSSSTPHSSIRVCAEDIVLMHHSQAHHQRHKRKDQPLPMSTKQYDASILATSVTLFGTGEKALSRSCSHMIVYPLPDRTCSMIEIALDDLDWFCIILGYSWCTVAFSLCSMA